MPRKKTNNWWILVLPKGLGLDLISGALITNRLLPGDISDEKKSVYNDYNIPGLNYSPFSHVRNDNTKITLTVPIMNIDNETGNMFDLYDVERVRSQPFDLSFSSEAQWKTNPTCIYSGWGTHRPPLPVVVEDCKFNHRRDFTNRNGISQFTEVTFVMRYLEDSSLYKAYNVMKSIGGLVNTAQKIGSSF
ncbi:hypothetical protein [Leptospira andrefontaineae]|uniref:Uncharacterized protein n=1 Tax=Leptospira andrefontaineae TaxID=2484976 RepID=A0A4R9GWX5_9LEPT|nr:hypothetical protein [Leptospira andrefontaineae]TGK36279.1 hypothetical protein EHO65_18435 [Leptospira andrefontaineae]